MRISDWSSDVCSSDLGKADNISGPLITTARDEFRAVLPTGGRLIGLDVGTKTIGLALCDARWTIASPAHTITRTQFTKDKAALAEFIAAQPVEGIVIGLPLTLDGSASPRRQSPPPFARTLANRCLPVLPLAQPLSHQ